MSSATLSELARRYVWWLAPDEALAHRDHFLCQLMQLGTQEDVQTARDFLGDEAFREALRTAPSGILDARSWTFWHLFLFRAPPPPMPSRPLPRALRARLVAAPAHDLEVPALPLRSPRLD